MTSHIVADVKLRCNLVCKEFFLMSVHTSNVSVSPFTLSQTDQIPFFFCAIPYHLVDNDIFPQLKGNHIKLLLVIDRYRNLKLK